MTDAPAARLFADLTPTSVPDAAKPALDITRELFGFAPNLAVDMAAEPAALAGYLGVLKAFTEVRALTQLEQQFVLIATSRANGADYSVAVHSALAAKLGADPALVRAAATGASLADARLAALQRFTGALTVARGAVTAAEVDAFLAAGFDRAAIVAVALGVAVKSFANSIALIAGSEIDQGFRLPAAA
jgi:AhpD family alkylhydroperoxidase